MNACIWKGNRIKNVYHCYNCGAQGNMLTLYCELKGITGPDCFKIAYREIREQLTVGGYPLNREYEIRKPSVMEAKTADYTKRNRGYMELLKLLN